MRTSAFAFATDLIDAGYDTVLDRLQHQARVDGVTVACNYHHSRDVLPHNPRHRVRFFRGETYFRPDWDRYPADGPRPVVSPLVDAFDPIERLQECTASRGLEVRGWVNVLHSTRLGLAYPDCTVRTCFGDELVFALCPAHPHVRDYAVGLAADLGARGLNGLLCETVGFLPFDHGWHHERSYAPLPPLARFAMGLCFCQHCRAATESAGGDAEGLRHWVAAELDATLAGRSSALDGMAPAGREDVDHLGDGRMARHLEAREGRVTSLVGAMQAAAGSTPLLYMDAAGGVRAIGSGMPSQAGVGSVTRRAWQFGADLPALAEACSGVSTLGYTPDADVLAGDVAAYAEHFEPARISVAVRPMPPDCDGPSDLAAKVDRLRAAGVAWLDLYHYAFIGLDALPWIGDAVSTQGAP